MKAPVIVVGAGVAGLQCARLLTENGIDVLVLEKDNSVGGRIRTDKVDGFQLDRGFQVLLTAYPEARATLDYEALELKSFTPGSLVRINGQFHRLSDPLRDQKRLGSLFETLRAPIGSVRDKINILRLRQDVIASGENDLLAREETTTFEALQRRGFSPRMIERFFRPFIGGIMLDRTLSGSSRMFEFVFRMFSLGEAALPSGGMSSIPAQLAAGLPADAIRLRTIVTEILTDAVVTSNAGRVPAAAIVVAVDGLEANNLLHSSDSPQYVDTYNLYFAADYPPVEDPILVLNGDGLGPINNLVVLTNVAPSYSADGRALVSVTVLGDWADATGIVTAVRTQMVDWFGDTVRNWQHVATYHIQGALPNQQPPFLSPPQRSARVANGVYRAGDYLDTASINGALASGRRAAEAVLSHLGKPSEA